MIPSRNLEQTLNLTQFMRPDSYNKSANHLSFEPKDIHSTYVPKEVLSSSLISKEKIFLSTLPFRPILAENFRMICSCLKLNVFIDCQVFAEWLFFVTADFVMRGFEQYL